MHTPPRSPGGERNFGKTFSPKTSSTLIFDLKSDQSQISQPDFNNIASQQAQHQRQKEETLGFNPQFAKTDGAAAMANAFKMGSGLGQLNLDKA
jgi:hypothetical protein